MKRVALMMAIGLIAACGGGEQTSTPAPDAPAADVDPAPAPRTMPAADPPPPKPAPTPAAGTPVADDCAVPEGDLRGDAAAGEKLYALYCVTCHGKEGKGDGPAAPKDPKPADHSNPEYMGSLSDAHIYCVINKGGIAVGKSPLMTAWGMVLNDQQLRDLVAYVRTLSGT